MDAGGVYGTAFGAAVARRSAYHKPRLPRLFNRLAHRVVFIGKGGIAAQRKVYYPDAVGVFVIDAPFNTLNYGGKAAASHFVQNLYSHKLCFGGGAFKAVPRLGSIGGYIPGHVGAVAIVVVGLGFLPDQVLKGDYPAGQVGMIVYSGIQHRHRYTLPGNLVSPQVGGASRLGSGVKDSPYFPVIPYPFDVCIPYQSFKGFCINAGRECVYQRQLLFKVTAGVFRHRPGGAFPGAGILKLYYYREFLEPLFSSLVSALENAGQVVCRSVPFQSGPS